MIHTFFRFDMSIIAVTEGLDSTNLTISYKQIHDHFPLGIYLISSVNITYSNHPPSSVPRILYA